MKFSTLEKAQDECIAAGAACTGVTKDPNVESIYSLRSGELKDSPFEKEVQPLTSLKQSFPATMTILTPQL